MSVTSREIKDNDARREETARSASMRPEAMNEDGSIRDKAAQDFLDRQIAMASTRPNERRADDHRVGTPQWMEEHSPENMHSDGSSTLAIDDPDAKDYDEELGVKDRIKKVEEERTKAHKELESQVKKANQESKKADNKK
jgi:hypothetical protein